MATNDRIRSVITELESILAQVQGVQQAKPKYSPHPDTKPKYSPHPDTKPKYSPHPDTTKKGRYVDNKQNRDLGRVGVLYKRTKRK